MRLVGRTARPADGPAARDGQAAMDEDSRPEPAAGSLRARTRRMNESVAANVTLVTTSMWFLYGLVLFVALWMRFSPVLHVDTAPAYPVMLYWVNLFQALMLPVLAVGQSVLSRASERRLRHESEVIDRLDQLTQRILALEEQHASVGHVREVHHEALMREIAALARQVNGQAEGPAT